MPQVLPGRSISTVSGRGARPPVRGWTARSVRSACRFAKGAELIPRPPRGPATRSARAVRDGRARARGCVPTEEAWADSSSGRDCLFATRRCRLRSLYTSGAAAEGNLSRQHLSRAHATERRVGRSEEQRWSLSYAGRFVSAVGAARCAWLRSVRRGVSVSEGARPAVCATRRTAGRPPPRRRRPRVRTRRAAPSRGPRPQPRAPAGAGTA